MGWDFVDLDELIEKNEKKSIPQIFEELGEEGFRKIEQKYLHVTFSYKPVRRELRWRNTCMGQ